MTKFHKKEKKVKSPLHICSVLKKTNLTLLLRHTVSEDSTSGLLLKGQGSVLEKSILRGSVCIMELNTSDLTLGPKVKLTFVFPLNLQKYIYQDFIKAFCCSFEYFVFS